MKRKILKPVMIVILAMLSIQGISQKTKVPKWVSEKGYWQMESNVRTPENFVIYFFNNDGTMVYKESLEGVNLNTRKYRTMMRLKEVLEEAITAWEQHHAMKEDELLVRIAFRDSWVVR